MGLSLLSQPTDIIHLLATHLDKSTTIQLWQTCKRTNKIVGERVPLTFYTSNAHKCCQLVKLFKKVRLMIVDKHSIKDIHCALLAKHIITLSYWKNSKLTDKGVKQIVNLTGLDLGYNKIITDDGVQGLTGLTHLDLAVNCNITDGGVQGLVNLTHLDLSSNYSITDGGIKGLVNLTHLDLSDYLYISNHVPTGTSRITNEGIKGLVNLTNLSLGNNSVITDEPLLSLPKLKRLDLRYNKTITESCRQQLAARGVHTINKI